ncbi:MAG: pentapeptide repeat-containing protein [Microcystaceae cyanobacterium]
MLTQTSQQSDNFPLPMREFLTRYSLGERNFRGLDLAGADLSEINLSHADLRGANFSHANLRGANLKSADLRKANFRNANLRVAYLANCDLTGANLSDADLSQAHLNDANLSEVTFKRVQCYKTSLTGATLPDGSTWHFQAFARGGRISLEDLLNQSQRHLKQRKRLVEFLVVFALYLGFEGTRFLFPFVFSLF